MIRRLPRVLATIAAGAAMAISLTAPAGALIDADQITGPVTGATTDRDFEVPGLEAVDSSLSVEGGLETVGCDTNFTDERASGGAASGSLPNQNAGGVGVESRCVGEADNAFLGDTNDNDVTNSQDNDLCVVEADDDEADGFIPPGQARRLDAGGGAPVNCVQAPSTVNNDVEVEADREQVLLPPDRCQITTLSEEIGAARLIEICEID